MSLIHRIDNLLLMSRMSPERVDKLAQMLNISINQTCEDEQSTAYIPFRGIAWAAMVLLRLAGLSPVVEPPDATKSASSVVSSCSTAIVFHGVQGEIPTLDEYRQLSMQQQRNITGVAKFMDVHIHHPERPSSNPLLSVYTGSSHGVYTGIDCTELVFERSRVANVRLEDILRGDPDPKYHEGLRGDNNFKLSDVPGLAKAVRFTAEKLLEGITDPSIQNRMAYMTIELHKRKQLPAHTQGWHHDGYTRQGIVYLPSRSALPDDLPLKTLFRLKSDHEGRPLFVDHGSPVPYGVDGHPDQPGVLDTRNLHIPYNTLVTFADQELYHSRPLSTAEIYRENEHSSWMSEDLIHEDDDGYYMFVGLFSAEVLWGLDGERGKRIHLPLHDISSDPDHYIL